MNRQLLGDLANPFFEQNGMLEKSHSKVGESEAPTRVMQWVAAADARHQRTLERLQARMKQFYEQNLNYYDAIAFSSSAWNDSSQLVHRHILANVCGRHVVEIGCGGAPILQSGLVKESQYTGCDFNATLLAQNSQRHPDARFIRLTDAKKIPLACRYEAVFSVFVIEHCVFPQAFLSELLRLLQPGGFFAMLCPDFLGRGRMDSQRIGLSAGPGREKLRQGKWRDALLTAFDNRLRVPWNCRRLRRRALANPQFFINLQPTCFSDPFQPDVDAVYVTFEPEIRRYLGDRISFVELDPAIRSFVERNRLIYVAGFARA